MLIPSSKNQHLFDLAT